MQILADIGPITIFRDRRCYISACVEMACAVCEYLDGVRRCVRSERSMRMHTDSGIYALAIMQRIINETEVHSKF